MAISKRGAAKIVMLQFVAFGKNFCKPSASLCTQPENGEDAMAADLPRSASGKIIRAELERRLQDLQHT